MYFYRLMSKKELECRRIHKNKNSFYYYVNTHKYKKGKNYVHLFLNAESCFEDFDKISYDDCVIGKFNIPDEILFKYGIELGGYNLTCNSYDKTYRCLNFKNAAGDFSFWLPEIAITSEDFDYNWCVEVSKTKDQNGKCYLPDSFKTEESYYKEIVFDGYLLGYDNENKLREKYKQIISVRKKIIESLKENRKINIFPSNLSEDSLYVSEVLINYALEQGYIKEKNEIFVSIKSELDSSAINITDITNDIIPIINKKALDNILSFTNYLYMLGFDVDKNKMNIISGETINNSLVKKC